MRIYHGTTAAHRAAILHDGLQPQEGLSPFLTTDESRAAGYAVRAVCDQDDLVIDAGCSTDYAAPAGVPPSAIVRWYEFDAEPWIDDDPQRYARLAAQARRWERLRPTMHPMP